MYIELTPSQMAAKDSVYLEKLSADFAEQTMRPNVDVFPWIQPSNLFTPRQLTNFRLAFPKFDCSDLALMMDALLVPASREFRGSKDKAEEVSDSGTP